MLFCLLTLVNGHYHPGMITEIPNAMVPRSTDTDPSTGRKWLYFAYDGTFQDYKSFPKVIKMSNVLFVKKGHNSDTMNIAYWQTNESDIAFCNNKM